MYKSMNFNFAHIFIAMVLVASVSMASAQSRKTKNAMVITDANSPLHLMQPDYTTPYGAPSASDVKSVMDKVLKYVDASTPMQIVDRTSGKTIDIENIDSNSQLQQGKFRLTSYEWGVTYSAMLSATQATGDKAFYNYAVSRMSFIAKAAKAFGQLMDSVGYIEPQIRPMLDPRALDDCGAICAAMMKAQMTDAKLDFGSQIDRYFNRVMYNEYRLSDGTLARCRPHYNTVWLDDMYMGIPSIALKGKMERESRFYSEAVKQIKQFADRMYLPQTGLFRHGWVENMAQHPAFYWARANGWAMLTLCEVLDVLPTNNPDYSSILTLLQNHIASVSALQSPSGAWHQLLDRNDTYLETSATAIYTYCIAHAINSGWVDAKAYGPIAILGWNAVTQTVSDKGAVEGTCVGTGMAFDAAFYAHRPVSAAAAHGYGPVIMAGAEIYRLLIDKYLQNNDAALQFYDKEQLTHAPIFGVADPTRPAEISAGSTRQGSRPVMFIIGDSTVKNGRGLGDGDMWGWGSFFDQFVDKERVSVENHALGGRSSRTFITEGLWAKVLAGIKQGDFLVIQFGHNDGGPLGTGRARASLNGVGNDSQAVTLERNGAPETVYTYGHYMRTYIRQAKAKGATVVVLSHTPGNRWNGDSIRRCTDTYSKWSSQIAKQENVLYVDLNDLAANEYDKKGSKCAKDYFKDSVHTTYIGAILHCKCIAKGLLALPNSPFRSIVEPTALDRSFNVASKPAFRDPIFDGAADPVIVRNEQLQCLTMFYTNRRANIGTINGVDWVHGTRIGMANSFDGGNTWKYVGTANIEYGNDSTTFWAPDIVKQANMYHMFVTVVDGIFNTWKQQRHIVHFTSTDLQKWTFHSQLQLASEKVIDAGLFHDKNRWLMFYNNESAGKSIYCAESSDLNTWNDLGPMVTDRGCEGPKVFYWKNRYFMIVDNWAGLVVYQSQDLKSWKRQKNNILAQAGIGNDDGVMGGHCDVVVNGDRAYIYYFTHPGRTPGADANTVDYRRSSIQVAELQIDGGQVVCYRDKSTIVRL